MTTAAIADVAAYRLSRHLEANYECFENVAVGMQDNERVLFVYVKTLPIPGKGFPGQWDGFPVYVRLFGQTAKKPSEVTVNVPETPEKAPPPALMTPMFSWAVTADHKWPEPGWYYIEGYGCRQVREGHGHVFDLGGREQDPLGIYEKKTIIPLKGLNEERERLNRQVKDLELEASVLRNSLYACSVFARSAITSLMTGNPEVEAQLLECVEEAELHQNKAYTKRLVKQEWEIEQLTKQLTTMKAELVELQQMMKFTSQQRTSPD